MTAIILDRAPDLVMPSVRKLSYAEVMEFFMAAQPLSCWARPIQTTALTYLGVTLTCTTTATNPCPTYPNVFSAPPSAGAQRPNLFLFAENYQQPYVQQGRIGIERELIKNVSLAVTYLYFRGVHLSRTRDINLFAPVPTPAIDQDGQTFTVQRFPGSSFTATAPVRPFANYNRINLFENSANSRYNGLAVQARRRFSPSNWVPFFEGSGSQFLLSYTFSKAEDDKPDQTAVVPGGGDDSKVTQNSFDLRDEWGYSDADQRHRFVFSSVFEIGKVKSSNKLLRALLNDFTVSGINQIQSGFAYSAQVGADLNRDGNSRNDRVPGFVRNSFRTPAVYQTRHPNNENHSHKRDHQTPLDPGGLQHLEPSKYRLGSRRRVFLVCKRKPVSWLHRQTVGNITLLPALPATAFGLPRAINTPRQLQLAVKFDF